MDSYLHLPQIEYALLLGIRRANLDALIILSHARQYHSHIARSLETQNVGVLKENGSISIMPSLSYSFILTYIDDHGQIESWTLCALLVAIVKDREGCAEHVGA